MKKIVSVIVVLMVISICVIAGKPSVKDAVKKQDYAKMKEALVGGADANETFDGNSALGWIAYVGNCDMIKLLVEKGAKVDGTGLIGNTPLENALNSTDSVETIIRTNEKTNARILKSTDEAKAREKGWLQNTDRKSFSTQEEKIKTLLELGADPNFLLGKGIVKVGTPFLNIVGKQNLTRVQLVIDGKKVDFELRFDQFAESTLRFVNKVEAGKYINKDDAKYWATVPRFNTPLLFVIEKNNLALVKMLVEGGADMNNGKKVGGYGGHTWAYLTPLDVAVDKKFKDIADYLKSKGAVRVQGK